MKRFRSSLPILAAVAVLVGTTAGTVTAKDPPPAGTAQPGAKTQNQKPSQGESKAKTPSDTGEQPRAAEQGRPHVGGGSFLVYEALHEDIGLSPQQRSTISALAVKSSETPPPAADTAKRAALAKEIRVGKIDPATVRADQQAMLAAMKQHQGAAATNVSQLHDALTKDQRAKLVGAIEAKQAQRAEGEGEERPGMSGPMGHLLEGIDLTQAQKDQIDAKLTAQRNRESDAMKAQHEAMKKEMTAKLETFKADNFDANAFVAPSSNAQQAIQTHATQFANELQTVVSVLTPAQREKLAQKIEQGPPAAKPGQP